MVQRVVVRTGWDFLTLTRQAAERLAELGDEVIQEELSDPDSASRCLVFHLEPNDPRLLQVLDEFGDRAFVRGSFEILEIPDGVEWEVVSSQAGGEFVREVGRTWHPGKKT